jgi:carbohydrate diacid regulator
MYLQRKTAEKIIEEIGKVLDYDINIMDETGAIIASTDPGRIDTFHEAAYKIIHENLSRLAVYRDDEYAGCRRGINLPICFNRKLIGVIGITGAVEETLKYADILKKMTEILASDLFNYHQNSVREQEKMFFFHDWLHDNISDDRSAFADMLKRYGLTGDSAFVAAVVKPKIPDFRIYAKGFTSVVLSDTIVIVGNVASPEKMRAAVESFVLPAVSAKETFFCAVGSDQRDYTGVGRSYRHAMKVLSRNEEKEPGIYLYADELKNIILDEVSISQKEQFSNRVFGRCSAKERAEHRALIASYCQNNGSVLRIAKQCFIHKNTVQYRINKLKERTGKDLRVTEDLIDLYLAAKWC